MQSFITQKVGTDVLPSPNSFYCKRVLSSSCQKINLSESTTYKLLLPCATTESFGAARTSIEIVNRREAEVIYTARFIGKDNGRCSEETAAGRISKERVVVWFFVVKPFSSFTSEQSKKYSCWCFCLSSGDCRGG